MSGSLQTAIRLMYSRRPFNTNSSTHQGDAAVLHNFLVYCVYRVSYQRASARLRMY
jgi:hypothetical protein